jgi:hypothetical protein
MVIDVATYELAAAPDAPLTSDHPIHDADFALEAPGSREHILRWWNIMLEIEQAPQRKRVFAMIFARTAIPVKTLHRVYYGTPAKRGWKESRDWRVLADRRKYPDLADSNLPAAFITWLKNLHESHQRDTSFRQTYRALMAALELWERNPHNAELAIPGYDAPPKRNPFKGYPAGWSDDNLRRRCRSTTYEKAVRRQGPKAASKFLPSIRTTRVDLEFGEVIYFDDEQEDVYVNLTGINQRETRPFAFNALEALSGNLFETGEKPGIIDGESVRQLDQLDFFWFVMLVLTKHGYNAQRGTTCIWELGLSTVDKRDPRVHDDHFNNLLLKATGGKVNVDTSGRFGRPEFKAMLFGGQPSGNFKFKSPIESAFNLLRNYQGALMAPTGRNVEMAPEESYGMLAENRRILKLIDQLPIEAFMRLKRPVLEWEDYKRFRHLVLAAINNRRDHDLEGWLKLGFTGARYRLGNDKPWIDELDYLRLPENDRALYDGVVRQPGNCEIFKLSPAEVFAMRRRQLTKLPMRMIPILAPERAWEDVAVRQSLEMVIERKSADHWLDSDELVFHGKVRTPHGYEVHLERGKTYKRLLNIFDPSQMWIAEREGSRKGAFIGVATRVQPSCKTDYEAILRQLGERGHVKAAESVEVHARMASEAERRVAAREFNRKIANGEPATAGEVRERKSHAARLREVQAGISQEKRTAMLTADDEDEPNFSGSTSTEGEA